MAYTAQQCPTLIDLTSRLDANGEIAPIAEVLTKTNPILNLLRWQECNMTEGYKHSIRTGLPEPTWRKLYQGIQPQKSTTTSVIDTCGNLETYAQVDKDLADINGNTFAWRMSEQTPFIAAMGNEMAKTLFYGDTDVHPERFMGLAPRYNVLNEKKAYVARNVISAEGTGDDLTSIYIVSLDQFMGLYPKGSKAGLQHSDKGQVTVVADNGGMYEAYRDHYKWQAGAVLNDWRGCARLCNIKVSDLIGGTGQFTNAKLINLLVRLKNRIPSHLRSNLRMFVPDEVKTALEIAGIEKSSTAVKVVEAAGQFTTMFFDIPIEVCDAISKNEAQVK